MIVNWLGQANRRRHRQQGEDNDRYPGNLLATHISTLSGHASACVKELQLRALLASWTLDFEFPIFALGLVWRVEWKFGFATKLRRFPSGDLPANELDACHDRGTVAYVVTQCFN